MSELATLSAERDDGLVIAVIGGEVDPSNSRMIGREITALVPNDAMGVVLDSEAVLQRGARAVGYLDSSGVQMVFELAERLEAR